MKHDASAAIKKRSLQWNRSILIGKAETAGSQVINIWPEHLTQGKNLAELEEMLADLYEFYKDEQTDKSEKKTGKITGSRVIVKSIEPVPKLIDCALTRTVLGQVFAVFQAFSLAKLRISRLLSQKLKFWENLYYQKFGSLKKNPARAGLLIVTGPKGNRSVHSPGIPVYPR